MKTAILVTAAIVLSALISRSDGNRFPELQSANPGDSTKHREAPRRDAPRKGYLEPSDNQMDSVLTLPKKYFASADETLPFSNPDHVGRVLGCSEV